MPAPTYTPDNEAKIETVNKILTASSGNDAAFPKTVVKGIWDNAMHAPSSRSSLAPSPSPSTAPPSRSPSASPPLESSRRQASSPSPPSPPRLRRSRPSRLP